MVFRRRRRIRSAPARMIASRRLGRGKLSVTENRRSQRRGDNWQLYCYCNTQPASAQAVGASSSDPVWNQAACAASQGARETSREI
ncbi:hypothetical protein VFPFJ_06248 [Purpureocillium lilacinum]|uniref:Uncharacterized protein n=1 Tax=Purpureocillium lilacinum TaxID=33203 RepID=A0A179HIH4_PURLI|nr:hypothetical protein VFPFJ_06248 [Purpureocillium lilacinum]OAQ89834.1 hypothetical protein VFPFJ_06248 [Purpureocillium lilacinum]